MPYPVTPWRSALQPASFRGVEFHVEVGGQSGGRRNVTHEFPKRDVPFTEDMGRSARRWTITGYIIGPDYLDGRDDLIAVCEASGSGTLVHPSLGSMTVNIGPYSVSESRERGGICTFEMAFVEAGSLDGSGVTSDTQSQAISAAGDLGSASSQSFDNSLKASNANQTIST